ncbi:MAG: hypothetical protein WDM76_05530 [Limisphaerales bacterium]
MNGSAYVAYSLCRGTASSSHGIASFSREMRHAVCGMTTFSHVTLFVMQEITTDCRGIPFFGTEATVSFWEIMPADYEMAYFHRETSIASLEMPTDDCGA